MAEHDKRFCITHIQFACALLTAVAFVTLGTYVLTHGHLHEDAYILFEYARSLGSGNGIAYYPGGPPTEGATDFLWMLLLAGAYGAGLEIGWAATLLNGLGFFFVTVFLLRGFSHCRDRLTTVVVGLLTSGTLVLSHLSSASVGGFGTAFYCGACAALFWETAAPGRDDRVGLPWLALLVGLIRPDGVIMGATACLLVLIREKPLRKPSSRFVRHLIATSLIAVAYFCWRWGHFGHLLPLPLYVKGFQGALLKGTGANRLFFENSRAVFLATSFAVILSERPHQQLSILAPPSVLFLALSFASQSQNISHRFQAPVLTAMLMTIMLFLGDVCATLPVRKRLALLVFVFVCLASDVRSLKVQLRYLTQPDYINVFPCLASDILNERVSIALSEAGRMAYWTDAKAHDLVGLNTAEIALFGLSEDYLEQIRPDLIFVHTATILDLGGIPEAIPIYELSTDELRTRMRRGLDAERLHPTARAPLRAMEYILGQPAHFRLFLARYAGTPCHLFAVDSSGLVDADEFLQRLRRSFELAPQHSQC